MFYVEVVKSSLLKAGLAGKTASNERKAPCVGELWQINSSTPKC